MSKATPPGRGGIWSTDCLISAQMLLTWYLANNITWDRKLGAASGSKGDGWPAHAWNPLPPRLRRRLPRGWGLRGAQGKGCEAVLLGGFAEGMGLGLGSTRCSLLCMPGLSDLLGGPVLPQEGLALVTGLAPPTPFGASGGRCAPSPCAHAPRSNGLSPAGAVQRRGPAAAGPPGLHRLPA